jgi:translation initiation factor IF-3
MNRDPRGDRNDPRGAQGARDSHRVNRQIRVPQIRVIGADGEQLGIMSADEGRDLAAEQGLDLVEVAPGAAPPVCRIMDYGKFRYEQSKKASQAKATRVEVKTITLRPKTDTNDLQTKIAQGRGFIERGDRVKLVMRLRGRENAHKELWFEKMDTIINALLDIATCTQRPRDEGRTITASLEPQNAAPVTNP